jgi:hypothetical protein
MRGARQRLHRINADEKAAERLVTAGCVAIRILVRAGAKRNRARGQRGGARMANLIQGGARAQSLGFEQPGHEHVTPPQDDAEVMEFPPLWLG